MQFWQFLFSVNYDSELKTWGLASAWHIVLIFKLRHSLDYHSAQGIKSDKGKDVFCISPEFHLA